MKKEKTRTLALKAEQLMLFASQPEFCPLSKKQQRIMNLIGDICKEKQLLKWLIEDDTLEPWLTNNNVLDRYLDNRAAIIARLKKLGYVYTEDEENHPQYRIFAAQVKKPIKLDLDFDSEDTPF